VKGERKGRQFAILDGQPLGPELPAGLVLWCRLTLIAMFAWGRPEERCDSSFAHWRVSARSHGSRTAGIHGELKMLGFDLSERYCLALDAQSPQQSPTGEALGGVLEQPS